MYSKHKIEWSNFIKVGRTLDSRAKIQLRAIAFHTRRAFGSKSKFYFHFQLSANARFGRQQVSAQVVRTLLTAWET